MKNLKTRNIIFIAVMSALSFLLYFIEIPIADPLKMDLSDIPVLLMSIASGPVNGIFVAFIKNFLHGMFLPNTPLYSGEIANFMYSLFYLLPISFMFNKGPKRKYLSILLAIVLSTAAMFVVNLFITLPLYGMSINSGTILLLLTTYTPFNIVKGAILGAIILILNKYVRPIIMKMA